MKNTPNSPAECFSALWPPKRRFAVIRGDSQAPGGNLRGWIRYAPDTPDAAFEARVHLKTWPYVISLQLFLGGQYAGKRSPAGPPKTASQVFTREVRLPRIWTCMPQTCICTPELLKAFGKEWREIKQRGPALHNLSDGNSRRF